jgi:hypothetical protein
VSAASEPRENDDQRSPIPKLVSIRLQGMTRQVQPSDLPRDGLKEMEAPLLVGPEPVAALYDVSQHG